MQLKSGRLLIPCNHAVLKNDEAASGPYISHAIFSDDGGQSWYMGEDVGEYTNECTLGELPGGDVYINMRSYRGQGCRAVARSHNQGQSWQDVRLDEQLIEPVCQGSALTLDAFGPQAWPAILCNPGTVKAPELAAARQLGRGQKLERRCADSCNAQRLQRSGCAARWAYRVPV